jgi:2-dehydropantoate 2-reductase
MIVAIVGGGAIGRLFGFFLSRGGHQVVIVDANPEVVAALNEGGIEFLGIDETNPDRVSVATITATVDPPTMADFDLVLLTVKSSATVKAAWAVKRLISRDCPLLSLQTGLGNLKALQAVFSPKDLFVGITSMSGTALGHVKVRSGGVGTTYLGELDGTFSRRLDKIAETFTQCGIASEQVTNIRGRLWTRVLVHAAINPVSTVLRVTNGCLVEQEASRAIMQRLLEEGQAVARACQVQLEPADLWEELLATCKNSVNSLSPMLQDVLNERPTETEEQNGALCQLAKENGLAVPTHETMYQLIRMIEYWKPGCERRC